MKLGEKASPSDELSIDSSKLARYITKVHAAYLTNSILMRDGIRVVQYRAQPRLCTNVKIARYFGLVGRGQGGGIISYSFTSHMLRYAQVYPGNATIA